PREVTDALRTRGALHGPRCGIRLRVELGSRSDRCTDHPDHVSGPGCPALLARMARAVARNARGGPRRGDDVSAGQHPAPRPPRVHPIRAWPPPDTPPPPALDLPRPFGRAPPPTAGVTSAQRNWTDMRTLGFRAEATKLVGGGTPLTPVAPPVQQPPHHRPH